MEELIRGNTQEFTKFLISIRMGRAAVAGGNRLKKSQQKKSSPQKALSPIGKSNISFSPTE